jgi:hypothetical protein
MNKLAIHFAIVLGLLFNSVMTQAEDELETISDARLAQLLAPVALYPDTVLTHVLISSTYPLEVVRASRWAQDNSDLSAEEALSAVEDKDWDPSVKALVPFKDLLKQMSDDLDWMQSLGDAFLADEERVLASIQTLRTEAYKSGNLKSSDAVEVAKDDDDVIVIETRTRDVVYVPYYDSRVVYGDWYWHNYPPVYWRPWHSHHYSGHHHHSIYWGPAYRLSVGFFFGAFHWHNRHIVILNDHHHSYRHHHRRARYISSHSSSRQWRHEPRHRRGAHYRHENVRVRYGSSSHRNSSTHVTTRIKSGDRREHSNSRRERVKERLHSSSRERDHESRQRIKHDGKERRNTIKREHGSKGSGDRKDDNVTRSREVKYDRGHNASSRSSERAERRSHRPERARSSERRGERKSGSKREKKD